MSPESVRSATSAATQRFSRKADIWSIGAILWRLIFKRSVILPRNSSSVEPSQSEIMEFVYHQKTPLSEKIPIKEIPISQIQDEDEILDMLDFLKRCLENNPKDRWTSRQLLQHQFLNPKISIEKIDTFFRDYGEDDGQKIRFKLRKHLGY